MPYFAVNHVTLTPMKCIYHFSGNYISTAIRTKEWNLTARLQVILQNTNITYSFSLKLVNVIFSSRGKPREVFQYWELRFYVNKGKAWAHTSKSRSNERGIRCQLEKLWRRGWKRESCYFKLCLPASASLGVFLHSIHILWFSIRTCLSRVVRGLFFSRSQDNFRCYK